VLTATTKSIIRQIARKEWEDSWETAKHGRMLHRLGIEPGKRTLKLHTGTHRAIKSELEQSVSKTEPKVRPLI
jgi:hypothetical protein